MKDLKITWKQILFISLGITLFNSVIDPKSVLGIASLLMTFIYFCAWINYLIYHLSSKKASKKEKIFSEIYFTFLLACMILFVSTIMFRYSLGDIVTKVLMIIISPYKGFRFMVRPVSIWIVISLIIDALMILMIRYMTKNDLKK